MTIPLMLGKVTILAKRLFSLFIYFLCTIHMSKLVELVTRKVFFIGPPHYLLLKKGEKKKEFFCQGKYLMNNLIFISLVIYEPFRLQ